MKAALKMKSLAFAIAASIAAPVAFADGRVTGRVSDEASDIYFEGAIIRIDELNLQTSSKVDGRFVFNAVPAGEYELSVSYLGAETVTRSITVTDDETTNQLVKVKSEGEIENVLVVGQTASANKALNQMRSADNLISVVTADAIGQLPDENVSEALQRVSGVFIQRDQGEGRYVGIRGIDSGLNVTNINGISIAAPEAGSRAVALDVIPSDLVESIAVSKTLTPDMDSEAIGGSIDVKSISAFDREGLFYKVSGNLNYSRLQEENGHKISGIVTNVFDLDAGDLGVAFSYSDQERHFGSENIETGGWEEDDINFTEEVEARDYEITRDRQGYALNLDFKPNENTLLYSRYLYSKFGDQEYRNRTVYIFEDADLSLTETSLTATPGEDGEPVLERELKDRFEEQEIESLLLGAEVTKFGWEFDTKIGLSTASESEPNRVDSLFEFDGADSIGYSSIGETPELFVSANANDTSNFELSEIVVEDNLSEDEHLTLAFDAKHEFNFLGNPSFIKLGLSWRDREKTNDGNAKVYEGDFGDRDTWADFAGRDVAYGLGDLGPSIIPSEIRNYVSTNSSSFEEDGDGTTIDSAVNDYTIEEDVLAYYAMQQIDIDSLRLTYGVRVEETEMTSSGNTIIEVVDGDEETIESSDSQFEDDYVDVLPSINARYNLNDQVIIRAAYFASIGRPSFENIRPSLGETALEIEDGEAEFAADEAGNPSLEPFTADSFDVSVEYYPGGIGVLSAGIFYKKIDNFIFMQDVADTVALEDFIDLSPLLGEGASVEIDEFVQAQNGGTAEITGVELAWTKSFKSGLLLQTNATLSDSEAEYPDRENEDLPLVNQSDSVANFIIGYENNTFSARLSTAYQSKRLVELDSDAFNDRFEDEHTQVDFSAKYNANEQLQLFLTAKNLTDEPFYAYHGDRSRNGQYEEYGMSFEFGVSYRNK